MSTRKRSHRPERQIRVRGIRRAEPDLRKLAGAIIAMAQAKAEAEAQEQAKQSKHVTPPDVADDHEAGDDE